jgi:hypothetical protein
MGDQQTSASSTSSTAEFEIWEMIPDNLRIPLGEE